MPPQVVAMLPCAALDDIAEFYGLLDTEVTWLRAEFGKLPTAGLLRITRPRPRKNVGAPRSSAGERGRRYVKITAGSSGRTSGETVPVKPIVRPTLAA